MPRYGDAERCPVCGNYISMLEWLEPRKIKLSAGKLPDRLARWTTKPLLVSERFKQAYEASFLTGISGFTSVETVAGRKKKIATPQYYCAEVGWSTNVKVDLNRTLITGQRNEWACALCNPWGGTTDHIHRLVLDTSEWNGVDVFKIYPFSGKVFVSERFYEFVQMNGFTNFNLVDVEVFQQ